MKEDAAKCKAAGMDAHITKPLDRAALSQCLSEFLESDSTHVLVKSGTHS